MSETRKKPAPFSLRLSWEERNNLERDAAGLSLGEYIRRRCYLPPDCNDSFTVLMAESLPRICCMPMIMIMIMIMLRYIKSAALSLIMLSALCKKPTH